MNVVFNILFYLICFFQLDSKTTELSKACEKQYRLEQELAFYKLDAKFDEFWTFPGYNEEVRDYQKGQKGHHLMYGFGQFSHIFQTTDFFKIDK